MSWFKQGMASMMTTVSQYTNAAYKNAVISACALISASDGTIEPEEKKKVAKMIGSSELLSAFNGAELGMLFDDYCKQAVDEFKRIDLMNNVRKLKSSPDQAAACVGIAVQIAKADGEFEDEEKAVVRELCAALALNPDEFV